MLHLIIIREICLIATLKFLSIIVINRLNLLHLTKKLRLWCVLHTLVCLNLLINLAILI